MYISILSFRPGIVLSSFSSPQPPSSVGILVSTSNVAADNHVTLLPDTTGRKRAPPHPFSGRSSPPSLLIRRSIKRKREIRGADATTTKKETILYPQILRSCTFTNSFALHVLKSNGTGYYPKVTLLRYFEEFSQ